jgi:ABC-type spermidine/putrescine transport system permease subunit I
MVPFAMSALLIGLLLTFTACNGSLYVVKLFRTADGPC